MQKDVFDDIFDTTDDDKIDEDDPSPVVPTPTDFQVRLCILSRRNELFCYVGQL